MFDCSWLWCGQLRKARRAQNVRRPVRTSPLFGVEGLEERALLTTFLPRLLNQAPVAIAANVATLEDNLLDGNLTATDANGDSLSFHLGKLAPTHGTVVINSDGSFQYNPAVNFFGTDSFSFFVNDGTVNSAEAIETISVTPVSDSLTLADGFASPNEDLAFPGSVVPLLSNPDGNPITFSVVTGPTHGTLTLNANGSFTYTPSLDFNGQDSFTFKANDTIADSNVATFVLQVAPVNDALKLTFPSGAAQIPRNSSPVRVDPAASVIDVDTAVNYSKAQIRVSVFSGNTNGDNNFGRVIFRLVSQGNGPGLVEVIGSKVFYNGSPTQIATVSGGSLGHALVVQFTKSATEQAVNAVLKQIALQASKKATTGSRTLIYSVSAGGQVAFANRTASVV